MNEYFSAPGFLILAAIYGGFLGWSAYANRSARGPRTLLLLVQIAGALALILAAAGLQIPAYSQRTQIVVAADVSDSILDKNAQTARLDELLASLDPETTEAAVAVFGSNAGSERRMERLPDMSGAELRQRPAKDEPLKPRQTPLPDLQRLTSAIDASATDIGAGIDWARGLFNGPGSGRGSSRGACRQRH